MLNYYQILGISATASQKEIVAAYRAKCKLLHPDVNPSADATAQMQMVNEAYHTLADACLRRQYDVRCGYYSSAYNNGGVGVSQDKTKTGEQAWWEDEMFTSAWWDSIYESPSWHKNPLDDWYVKHKDDSKKIRIPGWFWYVAYGVLLIIVIVRIVIPVIWGIVGIFKMLLF